MTNIWRTIKVTEQTLNMLKQLRHPGQSYDGFINELMAFWELNRKS